MQVGTGAKYCALTAVTMAVYQKNKSIGWYNKILCLTQPFINSLQNTERQNFMIEQLG